MPNHLLYSVEFFDLQLQFAAKVAELCGVPFQEAVGSHTNIYVRLGMGTEFNPTNPSWREYVDAVVTVSDPASFTYDTHCRRAHLPVGPALEASVGCFSYALVKPDRVRLHFHADPREDESPLSSANQSLRQSELAMLLVQLAASRGDSQIIGASWLYNLRCYRQLFPEPYLATLQAVEHPYQRMPLWGQFLNRRRGVRVEVARSFRARVARAKSLAELRECFPFRVLATSVPVKWLSEQLEAKSKVLQ